MILHGSKENEDLFKGVTPLPPPLNPRKSITRATEENYNTLSAQPFVPDRGFPRYNPNFNLFLYSRRNWKKLCEHPNLGVAPVVHEFQFMPISMIGLVLLYCTGSLGTI